VLLVLVLGSILVAGSAYQAWGAFYDTRHRKPAGRLIRAGPKSLSLHILEQGQGTPTVVLEAGLGATSLSWVSVQPKIALFARVASYDRAGLGWSDACSTPRSVGELVVQLRALLQHAGIGPPYILLAHSFGAIPVRVYAHLYPEEVGGIVFVEPISLEYWAACRSEDRKRLQLGAKLARRGALLARLGVVRIALASLVSGGSWIARAIGRASAAQASSVLSNLVAEVRKLPASTWPSIRAHWSQPKCFQTLSNYLEILPALACEAKSMSVPARIPVSILSASIATEAELAERDEWANHSCSGRHIRLRTGGHWVQLEDPDAVATVVEDMVNRFREAAVKNCGTTPC
jgi:pimeloyl-ACP methyl ester carboxylesterase